MAKAGDRVKVSTGQGSIEGILMPSPKLSKDDSIIVKLDNGYNIGIRDAKQVTVIERYKVKNSKYEKVKDKKGFPTVAILSTGGTISSKIDYRTGGVYADYTADDFLKIYPELRDIANIKAVKVASMMSEDMMGSDFIKIAKAIEKVRDADGIVLTMGTDTMHYTAAVLSFMIDSDIPIIITGSQRSIDRGSSDAHMNLVCAVKAAAELDCSEVMTCMHGSTHDDFCLLIRGTKVRKMHTSRRDAFRPINDVPIAKVYFDKIVVISKDHKKADRKRKIKIKDTFCEDIALVYVAPVMDPEIIDFYLKKKVKGIVIAATALGHVNTWTKRSLIPYIKKAVEKKVPVFITSQTLYGRVNPHVYTNLRKVSVEGGAVFLGDMMPDTAYMKLGWVLGQTKDFNKIITMMETNYAREFNKKHTDKMFLN